MSFEFLVGAIVYFIIAIAVMLLAMRRAIAISEDKKKENLDLEIAGIGLLFGLFWPLVVLAVIMIGIAQLMIKRYS